MWRNLIFGFYHREDTMRRELGEIDFGLVISDLGVDSISDRVFNAFLPMGRIVCLTDRSLKRACVELSRSHPEMALVYERYGPPPMWDRPLGFATLLNIILEQQVSLASAKACFDKLAASLGEVSPENVLSLNEDELKTIGFSRQKTTYARHLSEALISGRFDLDMIHALPDDEAKAEMVKLKGVGEWTSDVYLLMAMLRPDVMPRGDIALHAAYQRLVGLEKRPGSDEFLHISEKYRPFRSVAARLLWHFYLSERAAAKANARK